MVIALRSPEPEKGEWIHPSFPSTGSRPVRRRRWCINLGIALLLLCGVSHYFSSQEAALERAAEKMWQQLHGTIEQSYNTLSDVVLTDRSPASRSAADLHHSLEDYMPETTLLGHTPGCTTMDNLYVWNGTMYIVTSNPEPLPPLYHINSGWHTMRGNGHKYDDPEYIQSISPGEALRLFGGHATRQTGTTMFMKDTYLQHYAHFSMESILTLWTTYASSVSPDGLTELPLPERMFFIVMNDPDWRDGRVKMNGFVLKHAFPGMAVQYKRDWEEKAEFGTVDVYDRVVMLDRPATSRGENNRRANKILADVALQPKGPDFWKPVRDSMLMSLPPSTQPKTDKLVVTYVSRQHAPKGRRLDPEDNDRLEAALRALEPEIEVNLVYFEEYNRVEQIHMAARTDILLGLHGNGLTHLLWLGPQSLVIEMMLAGGWARDFELPATNLGHRYIAIHNDTIIHGDEMAPGMKIPPGFHEPGIHVQPEPIIAAIRAFHRARLSGKEPQFPPHRTVFAKGQQWDL